MTYAAFSVALLIIPFSTHGLLQIPNSGNLTRILTSSAAYSLPPGRRFPRHTVIHRTPVDGEDHMYDTLAYTSNRRMPILPRRC